MVASGLVKAGFGLSDEELSQIACCYIEEALLLDIMSGIQVYYWNNSRYPGECSLQGQFVIEIWKE